jgi:hypothetical protein
LNSTEFALLFFRERERERERERDKRVFSDQIIDIRNAVLGRKIERNLPFGVKQRKMMTPSYSIVRHKPEEQLARGERKRERKRVWRESLPLACLSASWLQDVIRAHARHIWLKSV